MKLTRAKLEQLIEDLVEKTKDPVNQSIQDAKISASEIDQVILVGGSTRVPAVQQLVKTLTGGKEPNMSVNPDEVVAVGAAIQAAILMGELKDVVLLDVTPLSLGLETLGGVMTKLIEKNTTIPVQKSEIFSTAEDNQSGVEIVVLQGEREMAGDNRRLGQFKLEGIEPAPRGIPQIEVTFDIDANGILNVSAKDQKTGKEQKITISGSTSLAQDEIDRMIQEAEKNAAEDQKKRAYVELKNQADSLVYQAEKGLKEAGDTAPVHVKGRIEDLISKLQEELKNQGPTEQIRSLMDELSQAAQELSSAASQPESSGRDTEKKDDDVIDVDFTEE